MIFTKRIAELDSQVSSLTSERDEAVALAEKAEGDIDAANTRIAELDACIKSLEQELATAKSASGDTETQIAEATAAAEAKAQEGFESRVQAEVTKRLAEAGEPDPIRRDPNAANPNEPASEDSDDPTKRTITNWSRNFLKKAE